MSCAAPPDRCWCGPQLNLLTREMSPVSQTPPCMGACARARGAGLRRRLPPHTRRAVRPRFVATLAPGDVLYVPPCVSAAQRRAPHPRGAATCGRVGAAQVLDAHFGRGIRRCGACGAHAERVGVAADDPVRRGAAV